MLQGHTRSLRILAVAFALVTGCGDDGDDDGANPPQTTAEAETGTSDDAHVPGSPPDGAPAYEGLGSWWIKLPKDERVASAADYAEANPEDCSGVDPTDLERQTWVAFGSEFPEATRVSEVMLETCALLLAD